MTMMHFVRYKGNQGLHLFVSFSFSITLKIDCVAIFFQWGLGKGKLNVLFGKSKIYIL
jgi:hypothetical protein